MEPQGDLGKGLNIKSSTLYQVCLLPIISTQEQNEQVTGHGGKANNNNMSGQIQRRKERAFGFDLNILSYCLDFLLSLLHHISFVTLCSCVISLMLEINFSSFHKNWLQIGQSSGDLYSWERKGSALSHKAPWPCSRCCTVYIHLTHTSNKEMISVGAEGGHVFPMTSNILKKSFLL